MIRMEMARILIRETDDTHIVELRESGVDEDEARVFPIVIGLTEAAAIERRLMGQQPPRPQTHELLASVIDELGFALQKIIISDLQHDELGRGTFFARLHLRAGGGAGGGAGDTSGGAVIEVDSRPSDALALGAADDIPIFVADHVLDAVGRSNGT